MQPQNELNVFAKRLRNHHRRLRKYRCLIIAVDISLRFLGVKKTNRILYRLSKTGSSPDITGDIAFLDNVATIFNQIKEKKRLKGNCLSQSLAMQFLLQRRTIKTNLVIGGEIKDRVLYAHAWLEKNGSVINDHPFIIDKYKILLAGDHFSFQKA